ncbi:Glyoxalase/Bleomycin resistance protein/Dioxygenase superfamily protein [Streptomyces sp. YIM 121038]|uniref:VOC family protein n=1 Tax=Streptomyces sp. YIM 121038 TaxID=2136401 RepID=UPI00111021FB|nr:VOC family protein [Streptomyces sp. YIM 121038]QCX80627.1 Glyoxalase/Bleomycin resistance protein/Dioxygenase superfamily protein [Streptomyces sp. YIM 121038]
MNRPRLDGVHHYKVPVSDLGESLRWYARVFGAERQAQFDHRSSAGVLYAYVLYVPKLGLLELRYAPRTAKAISGHDPVTYAVPTRADLRAWVGHLDALGVENSGELRGIIGWVLVFRDPDGLAVRLYTREHHAFDEAHADVDSRWLRLSADAEVVDAQP